MRHNFCKRSHCNEKPTHHKSRVALVEAQLATTRESPCSSEDPAQSRIKIKVIKKKIRTKLDPKYGENGYLMERRNGGKQKGISFLKSEGI